MSKQLRKQVPIRQFQRREHELLGVGNLELSKDDALQLVLHFLCDAGQIALAYDLE
jgi:hypothetical protein